jgi:hypothetical protein
MTDALATSPDVAAASARLRTAQGAVSVRNAPVSVLQKS